MVFLSNATVLAQGPGAPDNGSTPEIGAASAACAIGLLAGGTLLLRDKLRRRA